MRNGEYTTNQLHCILEINIEWHYNDSCLNNGLVVVGGHLIPARSIFGNGDPLPSPLDALLLSLACQIRIRQIQ